MPEKKRQHFVPRFYLKNFSVSAAGKSIGVLNIESGLYVPKAKLKTQAYRDYFYGASTGIEENLAVIEGYASSVIADAIAHNRLPARQSSDHTTLLAFIVFLLVRTEYAADEHNEMLDKILPVLAANDGQVKDHQGKFVIRYSLPCSSAIGMVHETLPLVFDLNCALLCNTTERRFVTSDNPVVPYNQFMEIRRQPTGNCGLASKGLQMFLPLSPTHCLLLYDDQVYGVRQRNGRIVNISSTEDVDALNQLQCAAAYKNMYFGDSIEESYIRNMVAGAMPYRRMQKVEVREHPGRPVGDGLQSVLVSSHVVDVRCGLQLSFLFTHRKAKKFRLGRRIVHVRNEELYRVMQEQYAPTPEGWTASSRRPE